LGGKIPGKILRTILFYKMGLLKINKASLFEAPVKTTPENVKEANEALFTAKWNLPQAAKNAGLTNKEMKITFNEYCAFHPPTYVVESNNQLSLL